MSSLQAFWSRVPFAGRLLVTAGFALLVAGLVMLSSSARQEAEDAEHDLHNLLHQELETLPSALAEVVVIGDFATLQQTLDRYALRPMVTEVRFQTRSGTNLHSSGHQSASLAPHWFRNAFRYDEVRGRIDINIGNRSYGELELTLSPTQFADRAWQRLLNHLAILLLAVTIDIAGIWLILHFGLRPLKQLEHATEAMASGNFSQRLTARGSPEIRHLIERFNHMSEAIQQAHDQLRQLTMDSSLAEDRERRAIARDLHDDIGQLLHIAKIKLGLLEHAPLSEASLAQLPQLKEVLNSASSRVRSLTAQLSPPVLETLGLVPALAWLSDEMLRIYGLHVDIEDDQQNKALNAIQATIAFRAARELLINVVKHSGTLLARVETHTEQQQFVLTISDQGCGMSDLKSKLSTNRGFGLASIRERISYLGGNMSIASTPGHGTTVILKLPLAKAEMDQRS